MGDLKMSDVKILDVNSINENQMPSIIGSQFKDLIDLEKNVQEAVNMAAQAKQKATNAQVSAGLFKKKAAIELLQDATKGLAEAQITAADAQKISFEYQSRLTEITKFLFGLGVSNLAMNRSVVRELELKLKGASDEEISDLAKNELRNVIMQLKAQEDILKKQTELTGKVKEHQGQIKELDKQIDNLEEQDQKQNEKIAENADTLEEHEKVLSEQQKKDAEYDRKFAEQEKENDAQDKKIAENTQKISEHSKTLEQQHAKDTEIEKRTQENTDKIISLQKEVQKQHQSFDKEIQTLKDFFENNIKETNKSINNFSDYLKRK